MKKRAIGGIAATVSALVVVLGGCEAFKAEKIPPCPEVLVLADAESGIRFAPGSGLDIIDIVYEAEVQRVAGACQYEIDKETGEGTLSVELGVEIRLARGAANKDRIADFGYFVALTDAQSQVIQKSAFPARVEFPGNQSRLIWKDEPVTVSIPIKKDQTGRDFDIYVGLDLTPEQVEYNRQKRASQNR